MNKLRWTARKYTDRNRKGIKDVEKTQVEIDNELKMQKGK